MNLINITEPLFQYIGSLVRIGENNIEVEYAKAKNDIEEIFERMEKISGKNRNTAMQYQRIKLPLIFFCDSIIVESKISFAREWDINRLAYLYGEMTGDHKFFYLLEETLSRKLFYEIECLKVFYICLGFGFKGIHKNNHQAIQKYMWEIVDRIPGEIFKNSTGSFAGEEDIRKYRSLKIPFYVKWWNSRNILRTICVLLLIWIFINAFFYCFTVSKSNANIKKLLSSSITLNKK